MVGERAAYSVKEAAVALHVNEKTIRKAIAAGEIPSFGVAGRKLIAAWWVNEQIHGPADKRTTTAAA